MTDGLPESGDSEDKHAPTRGVAAALRGLRSAAASSDGGNDRAALAAAVHVHTGRFDVDQLRRLIYMLVVAVAMSHKSIDQLTASLERITGVGTLDRLNAALDG